ncbi:MAG: flavin reductase family protein [Rhodospirillales bacterium]
MSLDIAEFRRALGCFATGVTVVATLGPKGRPLGLTVNSFNSVSLDPPLVLFSLDRRNPDLSAFEAAGVFSVNVLSEDQQDISVRFSANPETRWDGVAWETLVTGAPVLPGCLASFDCRTRAVHDGGDHALFLGEAAAMRAAPEGAPLTYYRGGYVKLADRD